MKISRRIFFVILLCTAPHLQAQSTESFVPILDGKSLTSADFADGETTVAQIEFIGLDPESSNELIEGPVYASDFIKRLREERTGLRENEKFSGYKVHLITKKVKEWLSEYGYEFAKVSAHGMRLPDNLIHLRFSVERGPLVATAGIRFVGNERVSSTELVEKLKKLLGGPLGKIQPKKVRLLRTEMF